MKNAQPSIKAESSVTVQGDAIVPSFRLPVRLNTVGAEVLCRLLSGERLTSLGAVGEVSTTRLSGHVERLKKIYGWPIGTITKAAGCNDGRLAEVVEYFLPQGVIAQAVALGSAQWRTAVKAERLKLRANAAEAKRQAELANRAAAKRRHAGEQRALFEGYTT